MSVRQNPAAATIDPIAAAANFSGTRTERKAASINDLGIDESIRASRSNLRALLPVVLGVVVLVRLVSLGLYPLIERTEARYGEMGRKMLETGNWITPQWDYGVPFWGKPPLSFWASAASMAVFGANAFAARFPSLLSGLLAAALFFRWPDRSARRATVATAASLIFLSSLLGFLIAGAVATDSFMTFGMTLSMVSFWRALEEPGAAAADRWLFFVGLAIGLLAKGPVALVMTGLALGLWLAWTRRFRDVWRGLPWLRGAALTSALTLPWYLAAESATPGFLNYFIVGEHWQRFTQPGWKGDLYGGGHAHPRGAIWLYAIASSLPWPFLAAAKWRKKPAEEPRPTRDPQLAYLLCFVFAPLLLFTMARNILETYAFPALPPFALFTAAWLVRREPKGAASRIWLAGLIMPLCVCAMLLIGHTRIEAHSQRKVLSHWKDTGAPLVYLFERPYSAEFYSSGKAQVAHDDAAIARWIDTDGPATLVVTVGKLQATALENDPRWVVVAREGDYAMLEKRNAATAPK